MESAAENRKCHVLLIYRAMIPSVRLCGHSQMEALAREGLLEYRAVQEMQLTRADMNWADTVLLGRLDSWYERRLAQILHDARRRLVYIIDDDLLNIPPAITSAAYYGQPAVQGNIRAMLDMSGVIFSPSPLLLAKYATDGKLAVKMEEPALEPVSYSPRNPGRPLKIGFAGSIDRVSDIEEILRKALFRIKEEFGDRVRFEFFGAIPSFARQLEAACIPYTEDYDHYRRKLNELAWDIGLAPMPITPFHACKHYNKFCEYSAAGVAGIYTDSEPYVFIPEKERFGRFCKNTPEAWYEQIRAEILDDEGREEHRRQCCAWAGERLSPSYIGRELFQAHGELFRPLEAQAIAGSALGWLKVQNLCRSVAEKVRRNGLKTPVVAVQKLTGRLRSMVERRRRG